MFEVIGAIAFPAFYAALVGVLLGFSPARRSTKIALAAAAALWGVIVVTIAGFGLGAPGAAGPVLGRLLLRQSGDHLAQSFVFCFDIS